MRPVLKLEHITAHDRERVGGKGFALATMVKKGLKVPGGVCIISPITQRLMRC